MRRVCLILPLLLLVSGMAVLAAPGAAEQGDAAYQRKAYAEAAEAYRQAVGRDSVNALSWFKLGNAQYRLRHTGEASYAYAKALYLQPAFDEAATNLEVIQQQVRPVKRAPIFFLSWWNGLTRPAFSNTWAILAILFFSLPLIAIAWGRLKKRSGRFVPPQVTGISIGVGFVCVILALAAAKASRPAHQAVIMKQDAAVRPAAGKAENVILPEGLLVEVLRTGPEDIMIELPDGREGRIQRSDIALVE
jgi:tetratricopeptide (TPR) repeat protein